MAALRFLHDSLNHYQVVLLIKPSEVKITKKLKVLSDAIYACKHMGWFDIQQILDDFQAQPESLVYLCREDVYSDLYQR